MPQQAPQPQQPPQAPQGVFGRMIQAESGGQQYAPNGQILTSPKGAQGIAQIMPSTGAAPGYGIAPATPSELATPEGNRAFGQRYFEGMYNKFGQDPEKAAAAYNAGPGRVQQNLAANNGQLNVAQLPQETQDYLRKVQPGQAPAPVGPVQASVDCTCTAPVGPVTPCTPCIPTYPCTPISP